MQSISNYRLIRSKRRSIALEITSEGELLVRAPVRASIDQIERLISEHQSWIAKKLAKSQTRPNRLFQEGDQFLYLGSVYPLYILNRRVPIFSDKNQGHLSLRQPLLFANGFYLYEPVIADAKKHLERWYKEAALAYFKPRLDELASVYGYQYKSLRLSSAKRRWGSCSGLANLNLNWRLIMAPISVIDYVMIHELCHLKEPNHSAAFWERVRTHLPNYKLERRWLKDNGLRLNL